jgi:hypothetical protein
MQISRDFEAQRNAANPFLTIDDSFQFEISTPNLKSQNP